MLRQETMVRSVEEHAGRVRLATDAGTVWARAVVGCDGSAGRIGRYVGVEMAQVDLGLELELELTGPHRRDWSRRIHLDWGPLPGSYGWVFPKGDWLTVGVIAAGAPGQPPGPTSPNWSPVSGWTSYRCCAAPVT